MEAIKREKPEKLSTQNDFMLDQITSVILSLLDCQNAGLAFKVPVPSSDACIQ